MPLSSHTLLATHAGVIRVMRCFWAGEKMETLFSFKTHYGQLFVLTVLG